MTTQWQRNSLGVQHLTLTAQQVTQTSFVVTSPFPRRAFAELTSPEPNDEANTAEITVSEDELGGEIAYLEYLDVHIRDPGPHRPESRSDARLLT